MSLHNSNLIRVVVFGATGECGKLAVSQGLERGYQVTAVVRKKTTSVPTNPKLIEVEGDVMDYNFVSECVKNQDLILCTMGYRIPSLAPWNSPLQAGYLTTVAQHLVKAMKEHQVKKLVFLTAAGVGESFYLVPFIFRAVVTVSALRKIFSLHLQTETVLLESGLDVAIIKPPQLSNEPLAKLGHVVSTGLGQPSHISRADVVYFMYQEGLNAEVLPPRELLVFAQQAN